MVWVNGAFARLSDDCFTPNAHAYRCNTFGGFDNWRLGDNNAD